jgi:hypothetical protein
VPTRGQRIRGRASAGDRRGDPLSTAFAATVAQTQDQIEILASQRDDIDGRAPRSSLSGGGVRTVYLYEERAAQMRIGIAEAMTIRPR